VTGCICGMPDATGYVRVGDCRAIGCDPACPAPGCDSDQPQVAGKCFICGWQILPDQDTVTVTSGALSADFHDVCFRVNATTAWDALHLTDGAL
jgi:hypothetical protein